MKNKQIEATKLWIIDSCLASGITNYDQIRYVLATVEHETSGTYSPVRESFWVRIKMIRKHGEKAGDKRFEAWAKRNFRYYPYYGRGYVQLTWKYNYKKMSKLLTKHHKSKYIDLVKYPDLALNPEIALFILIIGMKAGVYTGKKLDDYINDKKTDFRGARRIVNGTDKAKKIAKIAKGMSIKRWS